MPRQDEPIAALWDIRLLTHNTGATHRADARGPWRSLRGVAARALDLVRGLRGYPSNLLRQVATDSSAHFRLNRLQLGATRAQIGGDYADGDTDDRWESDCDELSHDRLTFRYLLMSPMLNSLFPSSREPERVDSDFIAPTI